MLPTRDRCLTALLRAAALLVTAAPACAVDDRAPGTNEGAVGSAENAGAASAGASGAAASLPAAAAAGAGGADGVTPGAGSDGATPGAGGAPATDESSAGAAGVAAAGAGAGAGGALAPCSGCVELSVPVDGPGQAASYMFVFEAPGADFSGAVVRWRVRVPEEDTSAGYYLTTDVQNGFELGFAGRFENYRPLTPGNFPPGEWVELAVDVSAAPLPGSEGGFDPRAVEWVALTLGTTDGFTGDGVIRVLVDAVAFEGVAEQPSVEFTSGADGLELNAFEAPEGTGEPLHHP